MNILSGISTLVIHPIGSGKSFIYQLAAYLYSQSHSDSPCTLVISPLISLMEDQIHHFPTVLKGACLHHNQTEFHKREILRDAIEGRINVLLLSPEALDHQSSLWSGHGSPYSLSQLRVAFACVDEVHCISEWSHCFRPSYFNICKVLRERFGVRCVLGLTATATHTTALSVTDHLGIKNVIRGGTILPDHLDITVSCEDNKDKALIDLLQSPDHNFKNCNSIIVYCTRQQTTKHVAELLNKYLPSGDSTSSTDKQEVTMSVSRSKKRKKHSSSSALSKRRKTEFTIAAFYHGSMKASERDKVQKQFTDGKLRIVVATMAFGMGLNKDNIRAIIHYDLPKSFESFVQEVGRAGRDREQAYCHVFIDKKKRDVYDLRSYAYGNTIDQSTVKQILDNIFQKCQCSKVQPESPSVSSGQPPTLRSSRGCTSHEVGIPIFAMTQHLDIEKQCIYTLLCYLELKGWLKVIGVVNDTCIIKWDGGAEKLSSLEQDVPAIATAIKLKLNDADLDDLMEFSMIEVANTMRSDLLTVRSQLSYLERADGNVSVNYQDPAFHIRTLGNLSNQDQNCICKHLCDKMKEQEESHLEKLHLIHAALCSQLPSTGGSPFESENSADGSHGKKKPSLQEMSNQYFSDRGLNRAYFADFNIHVLPLVEEVTLEQEDMVRSAVKSLTAAYAGQEFTGRSIARIFYGIQSPKFPAIVWGSRNMYWRRYNEIDFNDLCKIATEICGQ